MTDCTVVASGIHACESTVVREEVDAVREQLQLERIHLLGTSWGGMLALEHVLSGATGISSLILSSTLASIDEWAQEQRRLLR